MPILVWRYLTPKMVMYLTTAAAWWVAIMVAQYQTRIVKALYTVRGMAVRVLVLVASLALPVHNQACCSTILPDQMCGSVARAVRRVLVALVARITQLHTRPSYLPTTTMMPMRRGLRRAFGMTRQAVISKTLGIVILIIS